MKRILPIALVLLFVGCANDNPAKGLITACNTYAQSLSALADYKSTMSPARIARIDEIVKYAHPFCAGGPLPVDAGTAISYVAPVATELAQLLLAVK